MLQNLYFRCLSVNSLDCLISIRSIYVQNFIYNIFAFTSTSNIIPFIIIFKDYSASNLFFISEQILMATFLTRIFFIVALFSFVFPWRSSDSWSWDADESRNSESDEYLNEVEDLPDSIDWRGITSPKITL